MGLGEDGPVLASLRDEVIMNAGSRVDDYISRLPDWQQAVCQQVRQLAHDADPEVGETIKRSALPYFVLQGNICALLVAKDRVNVFIYDPTVADPHGVINRGHGNAIAGPCRSTVATRSTSPHCSRYSRPSSRTTAPAAGDASKYHPPKPEFSPRRLGEPLTEPEEMPRSWHA